MKIRKTGFDGSLHYFSMLTAIVDGNDGSDSPARVTTRRAPDVVRTVWMGTICNISLNENVSLEKRKFRKNFLSTYSRKVRP